MKSDGERNERQRFVKRIRRVFIEAGYLLARKVKVEKGNEGYRRRKVKK